MPAAGPPRRGVPATDGVAETPAHMQGTRQSSKDNLCSCHGCVSKHGCRIKTKVTSMIDMLSRLGIPVHLLGGETT